MAQIISKTSGSNPFPGRITLVLLLLLAGAGAFIFRLPDLTKRPMHTDEAVHALKLGELLNNGTYTYNPHEYHGPILYYCSLPFIWMSGARSYSEIQNEVPLRIVPVLFGTGLVLLLLLIFDGLGCRAALVAGILTAISPAMVYYSRYYIQEIPLVFFTFGTLAAAWRYTRSPKIGWALLAGACLGLSHVTKETSVIAFGAMAAAALLTWLCANKADKKTLCPALAKWKRSHLALGLLLGVFLSVFFMTGHFTNLRGALDSITTYGAYVARAVSGDSSTNGASLHNHPWYFYLHILLAYHEEPGPIWSEALIVLLAMAGILLSLARKTSRDGNAPLHRFLAFYTLIMTAVYCVIPYKTPWNLLGFHHGMILMAGIGTSEILALLPGRYLKTAFLIPFIYGLYLLGHQAHLATTLYQADTRNPYVYAHTTSNLLKLVQRLEDLAQIHPDGHQMKINVFAEGNDFWPLPWYLRDFGPPAADGPHTVLYSDTISENPSAPVVIAIAPTQIQETEKTVGINQRIIASASISLEKELDEKLGDGYTTETFSLRPDISVIVYIQTPLWDAFIESRSKP